MKVYEEMTDSDIASQVISDGGVTAGTAILCDDDYVGSVVNLAARPFRRGKDAKKDLISEDRKGTVIVWLANPRGTPGELRSEREKHRRDPGFSTH